MSSLKATIRSRVKWTVDDMISMDIENCHLEEPLWNEEVWRIWSLLLYDHMDLRDELL